MQSNPKTRLREYARTQTHNQANGSGHMSELHTKKMLWDTQVFRANEKRDKWLRQDCKS